jgi:hypothetical protein
MPQLSKEGILTPAPMYLSEIENNCFPVITAKKGKSGPVLWQ